MTTLDIANLDLSAGKYLKGLPVGEHEFLAVSNFNQLQTIMRDPRELQTSTRPRRGYEAEVLEEEAGIHELVQRALTGRKKANVARYSEYIAGMVAGKRQGVLPPIHLWTKDTLQEISPGGNQYVLVPDGMRLTAIDGETQLSAHFETRRAYPELRDAHGAYPLAVVVHHGLSVSTARQYFHDLNVLAVRPNTSLGLSMDTADPIMKVVGDVESSVGGLTARVERQARQLSRNSTKVVTLQSLRQMVINVAKGVAGIQYGARPMPLDDVDLFHLSDVACMWIGMYFDEFANEIIDRENSLAGAAPVLAAIGAIGNEVYRAGNDEREHVAAVWIATLKEVVWEKGDSWAGIAGKYTPKGTFSVGGTKETGYAVFNALTSRSNDNYERIRYRLF